MKLLLSALLFLHAGVAFGVSPAPVQNVKIKNQAENATMGVDAFGRASVKLHGNSDNTVIGNTGDRLKVEGVIAQINTVDAGNSFSTNLAANNTFTGAWTEVLLFSSLTVAVNSSWGGTLRIDFSTNGSAVDYTKSYTINSSNPTQITANIGARYYRIRYTNGSTATTTFRLQTVLHPFERSSTEQREAFEPENIRGRNYVTANGSGSNNATIYTVTPGRVLRVTGGNISGYNASLLSLGVGRLDIRDGANTVRFPVTIPGGNNPISIPFTFPTGLRFTSDVRVVVVFGAIQYSVMFTGYEADD